MHGAWQAESGVPGTAFWCTLWKGPQDNLLGMPGTARGARARPCRRARFTMHAPPRRPPCLLPGPPPPRPCAPTGRVWHAQPRFFLFLTACPLHPPPPQAAPGAPLPPFCRPPAMAKAKSKGKGKGKGKVGAPNSRPEQPPEPGPQPSQQIHDHNAAHYTKVIGWLDVIMDCPIFNNIVEDNARAVADGGSQVPYSWSTCQLAFGDEGIFEKHYTCGINFFWCDMLYSPAVGVPIREHAVSYLMDHYFRTPTPLPNILSIALREGEKPDPMKGSWVCLNPQEMMHAMLGAIARDVKGGDRDVAQAWRKIALTTTAELGFYKDPDSQPEEGHAATGEH